MTQPGSLIAPQPGWWVRDEHVGVNLGGHFRWAGSATGLELVRGTAHGAYNWASNAVGSAPSAAVTPTFDALGAGFAAAASTFSWTHTATLGAYVVVAFNANTTASPTATYGGTAMTLLGSVGVNASAPNSSGGTWLFGLANAPSGAKTVAVAAGGFVTGVANSASYLNAVLANTAQKVFGNGTALSQAATLGTGKIIVQAFGSSDSSITSFGGGTNRYAGGVSPPNASVDISDSTTNTTFTATISSNPWGGIAVSLIAPNKFASIAKTITPVITGALSKTIHATATPTVTPTIAAAAIRNTHAGASLTVTPTIAATMHLHPALVSASKTITPTISAAIVKARFGSASLPVTPTISAALIKGRYITAAPTVTPTISAAVAKTIHGTASRSVTPAIGAAVAKTIHASAALSTTPAISGSGNLHPGLIGVSKTITPTISAAVIKTRYITAAPTVTPAVSAAAAKTIHISAAPTVTSTFAATATKSSGVVTFDAAGTGATATASSISWSHTAASGAGIVVGVNTQSSATITGVTYNGTAMTSLGSVPLNNIASNGTVYLFGLTSAGTGSAATIVATASVSATISGGSASYINVLSFGTPVTNFANNTSLASGSVSSATNHRVHCVFGMKAKAISAFSGTQRYNQGSGCAGGDVAGATTVSFTATGAAGAQWGAVAVDII